jgi:tetratricopeptide (TPR) repeat protein
MDRPFRLLQPLLAIALGLLLALAPGKISLAFPSPPGATPTAVELSIDQRARQAYAIGNYGLARDLWQRAADSYANTADPLNQAMVLSNLSLALQHLGQAAAAQQTIEASLELLQAPSLPLTRERKGPAARTLAQALNTQASLRFDQGETLEALRGWQRAGELYRQAGDGDAALASSVNQAEALRILGNQREAVELLEPVVAELER